jgi:predicted ribosome quality control (RQC) complex YloA/Tae2 family protein
VAGYSGSHVVIRSDDDQLTKNDPETVLDAALLAAVNSKAAQSGRVSVSLTRCRNVRKPKGAKPGLVQISGDVTTINIDLRIDGKRLERLQKQP